MKSVNPFPFSDDNKRYHTWNYYLRHRFGKKIAKVPIATAPAATAAVRSAPAQAAGNLPETGLNRC